VEDNRLGGTNGRDEEPLEIHSIGIREEWKTEKSGDGTARVGDGR